MTDEDPGAYRDDEVLAKFIHHHNYVRTAVQEAGRTYAEIGYLPEVVMRDVSRAVAAAVTSYGSPQELRDAKVNRLERDLVMLRRALDRLQRQAREHNTDTQEAYEQALLVAPIRVRGAVSDAGR